MQVHAFRKAHGVYLHYDLVDLEHDREAGDALLASPGMIVVTGTTPLNYLVLMDQVELLDPAEREAIALAERSKRSL
jgi:hypothetical protein